MAFTILRRFFLLLFLLPTLASAQAAAPATYTLIAPLGPSLTGSVTLSQYLQGMLIFIIGIAGVLAVVMIVICGIQMMGSSVSGKSAAKECIWNAIFGLLIAIASWAILNTINPLFLASDVALPGVSTQTTAVAPLPGTGGTPVATDPMPTTPGYYFRYKDTLGNTKNSSLFDSSAACVIVQDKQEQSFSGSVVQKCFNVPKVAAPAGEDATRNALCGNTSCLYNKPLGINNKPCVPPDANGITNHCTNVDGLPGGTVSFLTGLPGACGCDVLITGGTENGHSSHAQGLPIFDLDTPAVLVNFIKTNATVKDNPSFCYASGGSCFRKWLYNGYWFTYEVNGSHTHWHVCQDGTTAPAGKSVALFTKACTQI